MYHITVIKKRLETEQERDARVASEREERGYGMGSSRGPDLHFHFTEEKKLEVELTDEEFAAMKKSVLETM